MKFFVDDQRVYGLQCTNIFNSNLRICVYFISVNISSNISLTFFHCFNQTLVLKCIKQISHKDFVYVKCKLKYVGICNMNVDIKCDLIVLWYNL